MKMPGLLTLKCSCGAAGLAHGEKETETNGAEVYDLPIVKWLWGTDGHDHAADDWEIIDCGEHEGWVR